MPHASTGPASAHCAVRLSSRDRRCLPRPFPPVWSRPRCSPWSSDIPSQRLAEEHQIPLVLVDDAGLNRLAGTKSPRGPIGVITQPRARHCFHRRDADCLGSLRPGQRRDHDPHRSCLRLGVRAYRGHCRSLGSQGASCRGWGPVSGQRSGRSPISTRSGNWDSSRWPPSSAVGISPEQLPSGQICGSDRGGSGRACPSRSSPDRQSR